MQLDGEQLAELQEAADQGGVSMSTLLQNALRSMVGGDGDPDDSDANEVGPLT